MRRGRLIHYCPTASRRDRTKEGVMKILIYGAGVLGSLYAARLHAAGHSVTLLARGQRLADLRAHGIVLEDVRTGQRTTAHVDVVEQLAPADAYDLIIVLMRKHQVADILPALAANQTTPTILFMTNNATGADAYMAALGRKRVLLGFPGASGVRAGAVVRVYVAPRGTQPTTIGELDGTITPRLQHIAGMFADAGFPIAMSRAMDAWLKTHVALVSPIANALYLAGGDNYRLARTRDGLVLLVRAIREGMAVLRAHGIPITPPKYRVLARLPEPLLVTLLQRGLATERAAVALAGHANAARDEMQCLAEEFHALTHSTSIPTPAIDRLATYLDPVVAPLPDGSATIPLDWQGAGEGVGAIVGAILGVRLGQTHRGLGLLSGALAGLLLGRRLAAPHRMPLAVRWQRVLARRRGATEAARLMVQAEERYDELHAGRPRYSNRAMRWHLEARILPILALYQTLRADIGDQDVALAEVVDLFHMVFASRRRRIALLRLLPDPFPLFRWIGRRTMQRSYPEEGWTTEWVADDEQRLAFNIRRCLYVDTLTAYGAPELMPHICAFDDWMFETLPPTIAWERTTTLGRGGDRCDFCWRRVSPSQPTSASHQQDARMTR
jgi:2-dehydropantoate 2-reductase